MPADTPSRSHAERVARFARIARRTLRETLRAPAIRRQGMEEGFKVIRAWAELCCREVGLEVEVQGAPIAEPCLFLANHVSYLDIPVLMSQASVTFVAKKEVAAWPLFGKGATAAGTVYIDRSSARSRAEVARVIGEAITKEQKSIALFPEGTSSMAVQNWKRGPFRVAAEYGFKIQPIRFYYHPLRDAAFIGDDTMLPHLWNVMGRRDMKCSIEFLPARAITNPSEDLKAVEAEVRASFEKKKAEVEARMVQKS